MSRAKPMQPKDRLIAYAKQSGDVWTPRQRRRYYHKLGRFLKQQRTGSD